MSKVTAVRDHLTPEEIIQRMKRTSGFSRVQRWLVIWNAFVDPRPADEIARHTGLAVQTVYNLVSKYNRMGPHAVEGPGRGGRRRYYLTREGEAEFLEPFAQRTLSGESVTVEDIKEALEDRLARSVHRTTVYRLLKRHGWRTRGGQHVLAFQPNATAGERETVPQCTSPTA
jgi:transposase